MVCLLRCQLFVKGCYQYAVSITERCIRIHECPTSLSITNSLACELSTRLILSIFSLSFSRYIRPCPRTGPTRPVCSQRQIALQKRSMESRGEGTSFVDQANKTISLAEHDPWRQPEIIVRAFQRDLPFRDPNGGPPLLSLSLPSTWNSWTNTVA